jgi:glutamyl-tRNA synthetase
MIKTRFAPSPTGYVHVGNLRSALYSFLFARHHDGKFILRIEDTDQTRFVPGATESLIKLLTKVGITWDEGVTLENGQLDEKGEFGPYTQSKRTAIYLEHANVLLEKGSAYRCFCSSERLEAMRQEQEIAKLPTKYDRRCLNITPEEIEAKLLAGEKYVIRMKIPDGEVSFHDEIRGDVKFNSPEIDDQVLVKSDGFPTYHLANIVDDHMMGVTHVIRGEEWLSSTPKHVLLYKMFGWVLPTFAHLPLLLNPDRSKLSKRQGDVAAEDFLKKGYLPYALLNFIALCGFNPKGDQEIYSLDELIKYFDLEKVNKSGAVFDVDKLNWMNSQYIHKLSLDELTNLCSEHVFAAGRELAPEVLRKICAVEQSRLVLLLDIVGKIDSYQKLPDYDAAILVWKKSSREEAKEQLEKLFGLISGFDEVILSSVELIEKAVRGYIESNGLQNGAVLWPLRAALSGSPTSPSPFELIWVLGREEALERVRVAVEKL